MEKFIPVIIVDTRESSFIIRRLKNLGANVTVKMISPGDYIVGEGFAVERKSFDDFLRSIFDKRIFEQVRRLKEAYLKCCLLIEGNVGYELANLKNPLVFWGALAKLISDHDLPVVFSLNENQSADFLFSLARKYQEEVEATPIARFKPKVRDLAQMQLLAVQGLPNVGPKMADRLLRRFKTVRKVFAAHPIELRSIPGIGKKRETTLTKFLESPYLVQKKSQGRA